MAGFSVRSEIARPRQQVWEIFSSLPSYENWNPFIVDAVGTIRHGVDLDLKITTSAGKQVAFRPHVDVVERGKKVTWSTGNALFSRQVTFTLDDSGAEATVFGVQVVFKGLLASFRKGFVGELESGYGKMAEALKKRAESNGKSG